MLIRFEKATREALILNPLKNFQLDSQVIEHRRDPLTGRGVIVLKGRLEYVRRFFESEEVAIENLADSTQQGCPFCPDSVDKMAPKFNPQVVPEGRISVGGAVGFPSLFAHEDNNAVVVPIRAHKISLHQMPARMFFDGFKACIEYFRRLHAWNSEVKSDAIVMNFYPPAGSTIAHPHMQALASDIPLQATHGLVKASEDYLQKNGSSYWSDLIQEERRQGERYLARRGNVDWITPFAPSGLSEAQAIVSGVSDLSSFTDEDLMDLTEGIVRVLRGYHDAGIRSFNMAVYSGPFSERADCFDLNLVMVGRYGYKPRFVSDVWALQYLLGEQEVFEAPEETCSRLRKYFD